MNDYNRESHEAEQLLYNHWLELVQVEQPAELIGRFRTLFIHGIGYPDRTITDALEKIAASKHAQQEFKYILNRCCHIPINRWQTYPSKQAAIPELIAVFEEAPKIVIGYSRSRAVHSIPQLVNQFTESEQYLALKRLAKVISHSNEDSSNTKTPATLPLGSLIPRYPYLYKHCLLSHDSTYEQQTIIKKIQAQKQQEFEIDLSQYVAHQVRKAQIARRQTSLSFGRNIQHIKNPTLLSDPELFFALKQFVGKVEGADTYRQLAGRFRANTTTNQSYGSFKDDLYEYLISSVTDDRYGKCQFSEKLYNLLQNTFPHNDDRKFNEFLMLRTCSQLLNFLVVESPARPNHFVFIDLISNLGATQTTGLLLKIVLICSKVKPYLEKRLAILFGHYELCTREGVAWLIKALENLNLALSTNFGKVDVSFVR
ncbi:hypothetical protein IQ270_16065 [Microcoleus sp. LEGE 07076]|uniref:hypothetical protein n=1 Tax=Microcoleus sp. LEGE 07076 TaxID=915322 RepID=UPI00187E7B5F|nr:hypothetical protein [Microcoleus sp. LEGE 07076]